MIYTSVATAPLNDSRLRELCGWSVDWNGSVGITGLLVYDGARFIQAIEGEQDAVIDLMANIRQDERHGSLEVLVSRPIDAREFGAWSMNFRHARYNADSENLILSVKNDVANVVDSQIRALFIGFAVLGCRRPR